MKVLYFDCFSGISGDMTLGALLDLGIDTDLFLSQLRKLNVDGYHIDLKRTVKNGISANYVSVNLLDRPVDAEHDHTHDHDHTHSHSHVHRNLTDINQIIDKSDISKNAKHIAKNIFYRVAAAEGKVHGSTPENVHFHEVGAVDSIVDIVGTAILIDMIKPDQIMASVINDGQGFTFCQHGKIPVPVPAVTEIFANGQVPFKQIQIEKELVTPTGAAIIAELSTFFGPMPDMKISKTGYGAGTRDNEIPNVLRVFLGEMEEAQGEEIITIETNIDDMPAEIIGYCMDKLFDNGALDVFFTHIHMKKNRPGIKITVLCEKKHVADLEKILFTETSTLGVRKRVETRAVLERKFQKVETPFGAITVKNGYYDGCKKSSLEYEEVKALAAKHDIALIEMHSLLSRIAGI